MSESNPDVSERSSNQRVLRRLNVGETIRMQPLEHGRREWAEATIHKALFSRSYDVITATGRHYRRNRRHLRPSGASEHDTTHDRAERMIPPSGSRDRTHDPETITVEIEAATTQQQETAAVSQNTRPSNVVVPEDTRQHGPMTTRKSSQAHGQIELVIDQVYGQAHMVMYQACRWTELNCS
ncbi:hypothetical protein NP493_239g08018 [Ridgeia piscesae]|uniref:Uncharacterized protein n=1 Tax=Ridgeia piscesae TaxID=27915 RepID=A0AAD9NZK2_RIDPI|nr:hypothetical protein NP493_239g08018 [Ridgeia piscesae]